MTKSMVHEMKLQVHDNPLQAPCDGPKEIVLVTLSMIY